MQVKCTNILVVPVKDDSDPNNGSFNLSTSVFSCQEKQNPSSADFHQWLDLWSHLFYKYNLRQQDNLFTYM